MGQLSLDVGNVSRAIHYFEIALSQACMHLYVYVCVYTYTYIHLHIHTFINKNTCMYISNTMGLLSLDVGNVARAIHY